MRVAIVYDCLYPHTVGGAERWYRTLAERLAGRHEVTYLTRRQWDRAEGPGTPFRALAVSAGGPLYTTSGRRRVLPPLRFGAGVFVHLLRHAGRYDAVHCASFPYFSLLGAWLALRLRRRRAPLLADWHEVWSAGYWRSYLGPVGGTVAYAIQWMCARLPDRSFTFSRMHAERLRQLGHRAPVTRLTGEYAGDDSPAPDPTAPRRPLVVYAGRHIPEKRVTVIPAAVAAARAAQPALRCVVYGDGPERAKVEERVRALGLDDAVELPGFAPPAEIGAAFEEACCMLLPSSREGYGLVVVESLARGTPAVVVAGPDNAAAELVEHGVNGFVVPSPEPEEIARALVEVVERGESLRVSTVRWYDEHRRELSIESSLAAVEAAYAGG